MLQTPRERVAVGGWESWNRIEFEFEPERRVRALSLEA